MSLLRAQQDVLEPWLHGIHICRSTLVVHLGARLFALYCMHCILIEGEKVNYHMAKGKCLSYNAKRKGKNRICII